VNPAAANAPAAAGGEILPVAASAAMREVLAAADDVAPTPTTVLLLGESGTGKEMVARYIHGRAGRPGPWVAVNCAALPAELLESELFGHEKGAFTGAWERRAGRFELAHRGTLLLDEISELPLPLQAKLLRVLQEREVDRVGGHRPVPVDARVIATSNRDLCEMVHRGHFRSDLYYRLNVFPIVLPPLRERPEDVPELASFLLAEASRALGRPAPRLDDAALEALKALPYPGNVRELRNVIERALVRCRGPVLGAAHLRLEVVRAVAPSSTPSPASAGQPPQARDPAPDRYRDQGSTSTAPNASTSTSTFPGSLPLDLGDLERIAIAEALRRVGGNRTHAARLLGIGLRTLRNKLRVYRGAGLSIEPANLADGQLQPARAEEELSIPLTRRAALQARASQEESS
jgi:two-component system, response regulator FlrC